MTYKSILYDPHVRDRMRRRRITRGMVRWLLARGIRERTRTDGGPQRWLAYGTIERRNLGVVFVELSGEIILITVLDFDL